MAVRKLTKAERLVNEQMLALLEWASDHPTRWHDIGPEESTKRAAELPGQAWRDRDSAADESVQAQAEGIGPGLCAYNHGGSMRTTSARGKPRQLP
jgi:hypothetical protein